MNILSKLRRGFQMFRAGLLFGWQGIYRLAGSGSGTRVSIDCGEIVLGKRVTFGRDCGIAVVGEPGRASPIITIGDYSSFQDRLHVNCASAITIGSRCAVSWDVDILDTDFHTVIQSDGAERPSTKPVVIGDRVWIGCRVSILKGVTIGDDCVVGSGAVVTRSFPPRSLIAGNPARLVKNITGWRD